MSSGQYITLNKNDELFLSYIRGSFSSTMRAIPTQNLNVNTPKEEVTFHIIPVDQIKRPAVPILAFRLFRFEWLSLSLGPLLLTYTYLHLQDVLIYHLDACLALIAVFLFHSAVFALNDYKDHVNGVDRISLSGGSQVIQNGWLSAQRVRQVGFLLFSVGSIIGTILILKQPFFLVAVGLFTGTCVLGYSFFGKGLKNLGFGEAIAFFCFGPMLTYGFSRASAHFHSWQIIFLGFGFGLLAAMCLQSRQLENIMSDSHLGTKTLAIRLGFDKMKKFLILQIFAAPILFIFTIALIVKNEMAYFLLFPFIYFSARLYLSIANSRSSLSSPMANLRLQISDLHILYSTLLLASFWLVK